MTEKNRGREAQKALLRRSAPLSTSDVRKGEGGRSARRKRPFIGKRRNPYNGRLSNGGNMAEVGGL